MKGGDISNVSSMQVTCTTDVVIKLLGEESGVFKKKIDYSLGEINLLSCNKLWLLANNYGISLELAGFESDGWSEELLQKAMDRLERRVVNPFNYFELYSDVDELVGTLPYRPNLKGVIDLPERVARYGSFGVELDRI